MSTRRPSTTGDALRRGWTTGACATAATRAAYTALLTGQFPDPVHIELPKGQRPSFALATETLHADYASAGIIKDAGDDPDVTHGALIVSTIRNNIGGGVSFVAGQGVGVVTKAGLPIPAGQAAINPVPRQLMTDTITDLARTHGHHGEVEITISIPGGQALALKTWNPRLGIVGGLSILGTTGIVVPYSCSAWIHSIHRGIDVARANGVNHVAGCTGSTSEATVRALYDLDEGAMLDMGDFAGGMLKYLRRRPVSKLTIGGGFGKLSKLAQGHLDLHSGRSQVDIQWLIDELLSTGYTNIEHLASTTSANALLEAIGPYASSLANHIANKARGTALATLKNDMAVDVVIIDRAGRIVGRSDD
ncbi:MAG: cobalt-precorrin-5B (C(1))-methyltransferase [Gammaproteobacteria bacterium]|nr:cobalt-precorrin-5B (C(1))-methyltransferase [Gammaproteobacteria bacterium]